MVYSVMLDRADAMDLSGTPVEYEGTFRELLNEQLQELPDEDGPGDLAPLVDWLRS